jgi:hypothetical protein
MDPTRKKLRDLSFAEQGKVDRMFRAMSLEYARSAERILPRNRYVDSSIMDLIDAVPDTVLLLKAWMLWSEQRQLSGVDWPISKFESELSGAVELARDRLYFETHDVRYKAPKGGTR